MSRISRLLVLLVAAAAAIEACGGSAGDRVPAEVTGVIVEIDSAGLGTVRGFTLKRRTQTYEIRIDETADYGFSLDHLHQHRTAAEPVTVGIDRRDGILYATFIEDAHT